MRVSFSGLSRYGRYTELYGAIILLMVLLWGSIVADLRHSYKVTEDQNESELSSLALAFSEEVEASVKSIDVAMQDMRDRWNGNQDEFESVVRRRQYILEREFAFQVVIIDETGKLRFSSLERSPKPLDLSDREYFKVHKTRSTDELFVSAPVLGRVSKRWSIQFTRPIYDGNDRFSGVIVISVSPEYFYRFYKSVSVSPDSSISLIRSAGDILARYPLQEQALGRKIKDSPFLNQLSPLSGSFRKISEVDGLERVYAWRKIEQFGIFVAVGHSVERILKPYYEQRSRALMAGFGLSFLMLVVALVKQREMRVRERAEVRLASNEERWRLALEAAGDGVWDWNVSTNEVQFSAGWCGMLGYQPEEIGTSLDEWSSRVCPEDLPAVQLDLKRHVEGESQYYCNEHRMRCKDGSWKWILDRGMVMERDRAGKPMRMVGMHTDISARKAMEERLCELATTDPLTGLNNRRVFVERMQEESRRLKRYPDRSAIVVMADLDHFKQVNDAYGHATGDEVLIHFANVLRSLIRQTDVAGRLGGEEFALLLVETDLEQATHFAERLCRSIHDAPVASGGHVIHLTVSVGVSAMKPTDAQFDDGLVRADQALYKAKHGGRNQVAVMA